MTSLESSGRSVMNVAPCLLRVTSPGGFPSHLPSPETNRWGPLGPYFCLVVTIQPWCDVTMASSGRSSSSRIVRDEELQRVADVSASSCRLNSGCRDNRRLTDRQSKQRDIDEDTYREKSTLGEAEGIHQPCVTTVAYSAHSTGCSDAPVSQGSNHRPGRDLF